MADKSVHKFSWDEYVKEKCIGTGGFGTLYLCKNRKYKTCVVKEIHILGAPDEEITAVDKEASLLSSLSHPNIITYYDHAVENKTVYIIMEYAPGGDLNKHILSKEDGLKEREVVEILSQVLCGLEYLHSRDIIHRDVSARNVLLARGGVIKLADFGLSRRIESLSSSGGPIGHPGNFAPELCWGGQTSKASDIWAVGCLLYHLCCGHPPFSSPSLAGTVRLILNSDQAPKIPQSYSASLRELLSRLLAKAPKDRPDAASLLAWPCLARAVHSAIARLGPPAEPEEILIALGFNV